MDFNKKLEDILSGVDPNKLQSEKQKISSLLQTPDGQKLKKQLEKIDKQKLLNQFSNLNVQDIRKKLSQMDTSKLANLNIDEMIDKLKNI